jgi:hypothetical protein
MGFSPSRSGSLQCAAGGHPLALMPIKARMRMFDAGQTAPALRGIT